MVGIVGCNWDGNDDISVGDFTVYVNNLGVNSSNDNYDVGIDVDLSGDIAVGDMTNYMNFMGMNTGSVQYHNTTIQN